jgi:transcriptional regulator with XRE-family HTH domain
MGDRLRLQRENMNLTQEELSKKLGIKRDRYAKYETGATPVPGKLVIKFADYFKVSTDYLYGRSDDPKLPQMTDPEVIREIKETKKMVDEAFERFTKAIEKQSTKQDKSPK